MLEDLPIQVARSTPTRVKEDWYEHIIYNNSIFRFLFIPTCDCNIIFFFFLQEADMKQEVDPADFFVYRHKYKQGPKKGEWVDSRSQTVHVSYIMIYIYIYVNLQF